MHYQYIFVCLAYSLLAFFSCRNMTLRMIEKIGINCKFYPQKFIVLPFKTRKIFKINQKTIPRYLFFELFLSIFFLLLGPINLIFLFAFKTKETAGILILFQSCLIVINIFYFSVMSCRYRK